MFETELLLKKLEFNSKMFYLFNFFFQFVYFLLI